MLKIGSSLIDLFGYQLIQDKLVWMLNEISKGQLLALQVGKNKDDGSLKHTQVSMLNQIM